MILGVRVVEGWGECKHCGTLSRLENTAVYNGERFCADPARCVLYQEIRLEVLEMFEDLTPSPGRQLEELGQHIRDPAMSPAERTTAHRAAALKSYHARKHTRVPQGKACLKCKKTFKRPKASYCSEKCARAAAFKRSYDKKRAAV